MGYCWISRQRKVVDLSMMFQDFARDDIAKEKTRVGLVAYMRVVLVITNVVPLSILALILLWLP